MSLGLVLVHLAVGTVVLLSIGSGFIIGRARLSQLLKHLRPRLLGAAPYVALLAVVLFANSRLRTVAQDVSWLVGFEITSLIYAAEGDLVPWIQSFASPPLTVLFSAIYVYGYVFLLTFPVLAYLALADDRPLRTTCLAYSYNYTLGLVLYVLFIAYGPRNLLVPTVESLMYTTWPESQLLTAQVNANTNVFPSLHASLSATVVLLAYRTRATYPRWLVVSTILGGAIVLSTMYLGIHWGVDVLAGAILGVASVIVAERWDPVAWLRRRVDRVDAGEADGGLDRTRGN